MRMRRLIGRARPRRVAAPGPSSQRGFNIIELMVVIAVLSTLILIAITAYRNYTTRTHMLEVLLAAGKCKTEVYEAYYFGERPAGGWACTRGSGTYVQSIAVDDNGKVTIVVHGFDDSDINGSIFTFAPIIDGAPAVFENSKGKILQWRCGSTADGTTVPARALPFSCRS